MTSENEPQRPEPPIQAPEYETLQGFLEFLRATIAWKCSGLTAEQANTTAAASDMTLGGILKHLAWVEDNWFGQFLHGQDPAPEWAGADWNADPDWEWTSAASEDPEELLALWNAKVDQSRRLTDRAMSDGGLDRLADRAWSDGKRVSLRWILTHMIEEYARHAGHADLIRESVDGLTGE
ncbi:DinB family protein [Salininema proteolyticum]|uniref:DinB family protein n=1 Tax=Salininema proteolyticum TaxID=1607685 RepID=A0ABV8U2L9_9ACTN